MTKSHVGTGHKLCPICGEKHGEVVLMSARLKDLLERDNFMGFDLCPEHAQMQAKYLALVELSGPRTSDTAKTKDVFNRRTGNIAHVLRTAVPQLFNTTLSPDLAFIYVEPGVIGKLQALQAS